MYQQAFCHWLREAGIPFVSKAAHHLMLDGEIAHTLFPDLVAWDCIMIELTFSALFDGNDFNVHRCLSFMSALGVPFGVAVNFGKHHLHINALAHPPSSIRGTPLASAGLPASSSPESKP